MSHVYAHPEAEVAHVAAPQLQRACACGESAGVSGKCPECAAREQLGVQPKLSLNRPGDRFEQEADRIADRVVSARGPGAAARTSPLLQRQPEGAEEEDEEEIQAKSAGGPVAGAAVGHAAAAVAGGGRPLSGGERSWFEPRLGRDLSAVRLHDDARAGAAARGINARAYTLRNHIAFAPGAYDPGSTEGRRLMAHELVHTLQQQGGRASDTVRRQPSVRCTALMRRPTPSDMTTGNLVEAEIVAHFAARYGPNQRARLPDASFAPYRTGTRRFEPKLTIGGTGGSLRGSGRPDLALRSRGADVMLLAEIKPANLSQFITGEAQLLNYINKGNSEDNLETRRELGIRVFSPMSQVGARYATPRFVSLGGRRFRVMWCGPGVIVYKEIGSKKKEEKKKKKKADIKKKSQGKSAKKTTAKKTATTGAKKAALKKGGKQVIKGVGKKAVLKGAAKKLIPGAAYVEAAAVAAALLAGAKPAFGGEGMSAEEALLEIAKHGPPPDVEMSDELQELLKANPDVLERLRAVAGGEATSDKAAQAMIDMLEANIDLLDAETLEGIAKMAESSGDPRLAKTAAEVRKTLEAIRAGKEPTAGAGEGEAEAETEAEAEGEAKPEGEAKAEASEGGPAGKAASGVTLPEDFKEELKAKEQLSNLFEEVLDRTKEEGFEKTDVDRFRRAVAGLSEEQIKQILDHVAKLPPVEAEATEPKQKVLDVVVELAAKVAAGEKLTPEPTEEATPEKAAPEAAESVETAGGPIVINETKLEWIKDLLPKVTDEQPGWLQIALTDETIIARVSEMKAKAEAGEKGSLGIFPAAYAAKLPADRPKGVPDRLGAFVAVRIKSFTGNTMTAEVYAASALVDGSGTEFSGPSPVGKEFQLNASKYLAAAKKKK